MINRTMMVSFSKSKKDINITINEHCYPQHFLFRKFGILYENNNKACQLIYVQHDFLNAKVKRRHQKY